MAAIPKSQPLPTEILDPSTTNTTAAAAATSNGNSLYPDSASSSPRSRNSLDTEPPYLRWDDAATATATATTAPTTTAAAAVPASTHHHHQKLRLMCSYGGRIIPRPYDRSLCYLGGETRIVVADRSSPLSDLTARLSRLILNGRPFTLKYQLPNEDLDSLISVATDDDLENMIDEYDRCIQSPKPSRLRLFLFPAKPETTTSLGSLLEDSKAENWFVDALNDSNDALPRGFSDTAAEVNSLLGLDSPNQKVKALPPVVVETAAMSVVKTTLGSEAQSLPDSPMVETTSSFGSTNSALSVSNLPPIKIRSSEDSVEEHFGNINIRTPPTLPPVEVGVKSPVEMENPQRENAPPPPQPQPQLLPSTLPLHMKPMYYPNQTPVQVVPNPNSAAVTQIPAASVPKQEIVDHNYRVQIPYTESTYLLPQSLPPEYHYLSHQPPPLPSFYQLHHSQHPQQQQQQPPVEQTQPIPMYFVHPSGTTMASIRPNQTYVQYQLPPMADPMKPMQPPPSKEPSPIASPYAPTQSSRPPLRPESTANYRTTAIPFTHPQSMHAPEQHQYAGYQVHQIPHMAYEYSDQPPQLQPMYYMQPTVAASATAAAPTGGQFASAVNSDVSLQRSPDSKTNRS